ncbi:MAG: hypothetical protein SPJ83_02180 [Helicobacter sp.]|uniref:Uncharacterized protein n=3 Tax=Helicobacter bilis TaxID=37372 RepID=T5LPX1_9HELI|nr:MULTISPECIES: hypothetical protein [Helicobacter]AQQ59242.1 hypothetical protein XJ32_03045 [Helicobacter bilis]EMZ35901.1 hypothetical protein C826_02427 [Helicobacter bilis WiWa]EQM94712.1 hypothetical protein HRAG_02476 [Helicobacter bilis ATCC 43879]MDY5821595.1 hypothetical protein [Helicobacter sp.]MDY5950401.1 hypothetical protein [Helicobacter sp.]
MKKVLVALCFCLSCVYSSSDRYNMSLQLHLLKAREYIDALRSLGVGYCLGYDIEKLYDEAILWFGFDDSKRNDVINEIKMLINTQKIEFVKPKRKYDEKAQLFHNCFLMYNSSVYQDEIENIAKKYCKNAEVCENIKRLTERKIWKDCKILR